MTHTSRSLRAALACGRAALLLGGLAAAAPVSAETALGSTLKDTAIAGAVATWAVALLQGAPVGHCLVHGQGGDVGDWGIRGQGGTDAELDYLMVAAERRACHLLNEPGFSLDVSPVIGFSSWHANSSSLYSHDAWDISYVPMMHWRTPTPGRTAFDLEFGIGPSYLSQSSIGDRVKSTNFQFSDHFGLGLGDAEGHWRVGFEFRHVSNLSIRTPNTAVDFKGLALSWRP